MVFEVVTAIQVSHAVCEPLGSIGGVGFLLLTRGRARFKYGGFDRAILCGVKLQLLA